MTLNLALPPRPRGILRYAAIELSIWAAVYGTYLAVRGLTIGSADVAVRHATDVVDIERAVGAFREARVQDLLSPVLDFFSTYYILGFGPLIATFAIWLGVRRPELYKGLRNALLLSVSMAAVVYVTFPTAPPRLAGLGIHDTVGMSGHDTGSVMGIRFNPYAAVPSMHVGWSVVVAYFGWRAFRSRFLRGLFLAHPVLMALSVTATGNHFFFDSVTGAAVAALTLGILERRRRRPVAPVLRVIEGGGERADEDERLAA